MVAANVDPKTIERGVGTAETDDLFRHLLNVGSASQLLEAAKEAVKRGFVPVGHFLHAAKKALKLNADEVGGILEVLKARPTMPGASQIIRVLENWKTRATYSGATKCPELRSSSWNANSPTLPARDVGAEGVKHR